MSPKQSSPAQSPLPPRQTHCTCAMLRRTARRVTQAYDSALKPLGLKLTQYSVLANVARDGGLSITELADLLATDRTTLTRNLRPMERAGWITVAAGADRRCRAVGITKAGQALFEQALPLWQAAEQRFRRQMGRETAADLRRLLDEAMLSATE